VAKLDEISGVGKIGAQELIAGIGVDMARFPTAGHLVSRAKFAPRARPAGLNPAPPARAIHGSAAPSARPRPASPGPRPSSVPAITGSPASAASSAPSSQTGRSILVAACHLLSDPEARFADLGPDWHDRIAPLRRKRQLIAGLGQRMSGKKVLLQEAAV
jgi:hypothetical protein